MVPRTSNNAKPTSYAKLKEAPQKGSSTAKTVDKVLSKNPEAKHVFLHKSFGLKELSLETPSWIQKKLSGDEINADTREFFNQLGVDNLFHADPGVQKAAAFVATAAQSGVGEFELTTELRLAVKKLANPADSSFDDYQAAKHVEIKGGFGKHSLEDIAAKAYRPFISSHGSVGAAPESAAPVAKQNKPVDAVQTDLGVFTFDELKQRADASIAFVQKNSPRSTAESSAPAKKPDFSEIDNILNPVAHKPAHAPLPLAESTPYALKQHYEKLLQDRERTGTYSDAAAVDEFTSQMRRQDNPYKEPVTSGEVSDLVSFITGHTMKLSMSEGMVPMNKLGDRTFDGPFGRFEALHHLCFNTSFLLDLKPHQVDHFMGIYEQLWDENKGALREQAA